MRVWDDNELATHIASDAVLRVLDRIFEHCAIVRSKRLGQFIDHFLGQRFGDVPEVLRIECRQQGNQVLP